MSSSSSEVPRAESVRGVKGAGGRDILARSVEVTERSRGGEGGVVAADLSGETGEGRERSRLEKRNQMEQFYRPKINRLSLYVVSSLS